MKQIIKTLTFIAIILMAVSCKWTSTTETKSLQHQVNKDLYGYTTEELLDKLGQPTFIEKETLEGIPVTMLRFEDKKIPCRDRRTHREIRPILRYGSHRVRL